MLRALLDSNVLISAAVRPDGTPDRIVFALLSRNAFELVISPNIVAEVERALDRTKIRRYLQDPRESFLWLADVAALADLVEDTGRVAGVCRDPADDMVLSDALEGRADAIVTGDADLLALEQYERIPILASREFLRLVDR